MDFPLYGEYILQACFWSLIKIIKFENQAKILLRYYEQTLSTFQPPYNLHKPPRCFTLPSFQYVLWLNLRKHLLFSGFSCAETLL